MASFVGSYAVLGVLVHIFGVGTLWFSWVNKMKSLPLILVGWGLIGISLVLWGYAGGADRGVAMGLLSLGAVALMFVGLSAAKMTPSRKKESKITGREFLNKKKLPPKRIAINIGWWVFLFLGCGLSAYAATLGVHELFVFTGTHLSNALLWSLLLFPMIWGALAIYMLASENWRNRLLSLLGCFAFGTLMLVWGN